MFRILADLRFALRQLRKSPGFTLSAVASLAIGLGATTAIYSVVHASLLAPVGGLGDAERLVDIGSTREGRGFDTFSYPDYRDFAENSKTLAGIYAWRFVPLYLRASNDAGSESALGFQVSANYFEVLGVRPAAGRFFAADEESTAGGATVAVASHDYFARAFGGRAEALGSSFFVDGRPFTLVGVAPPGFHGHLFGLSPELFVPLTTPLGADRNHEALMTRRAKWLLLGGRLSPGATIAQARAELVTIAARLAVAFPDSNALASVDVMALGPLPGEAKKPGTLFAALLFVIVGLVLAIACVNVASMLLARTEGRMREVALRQALGASRARIAGQLLVESLLLFVLAAVPGLYLARAGVDALKLLRPPTPFPVHLDFPLDLRVLAFTAAITLGTGVLFGLAPALQAARRAPQPALRDRTASGGVRRLRLRTMMVGGQVGLSLLLLAVAGLLLHALGRANSIALGFDPRGVASFEIHLDTAGYDAARAGAFVDAFLDRARALPGIAGVSTSRMIPLDQSSLGLGGVEVDGIESPSKSGFGVDANVVSPRYFETLRIPLGGRDFTAADRAGAARVAIVNETFAERFFHGDALGRTFRLGESGDWTTLTVVGVARNSKYRSLGEEKKPFYWVPAAQQYLPDTVLLVRAADGRAASVARAVADLLHDLDPNLPAPPPISLEEIAATSTLPQRIAGSVAGVLGGVALLLAGVGLYGVVAFAVAQRTREIAIRAVLGARPREILRLVALGSARPLAVGAALGLVAAVAVSRLLEPLRMGLPLLDPAVFVGVPLLLAVVAALATFAPARRAISIPPADALRAE